MNDRDLLNALRVATECAEAAGISPRMPSRLLEGRIRQLDLMLALGGPDLHRFVGREHNLSELRFYWDVHSSRVAISGPGGMGKSLLVSRFIANLLENDRTERPAAVFHLDFDRRDLLSSGRGRSSSLGTLMSEILSQATRWLPPQQVQRLLQRQAVSSSQLFGSESISQSRSSSQRSARGNLMIELGRLFDRSRPFSFFKRRPARVVLIFDSMEQVLGFDDEAVLAVSHISETLRAGGAEPFTICISRSFAGGGIGHWVRDPHIDLEQFTNEEAKTYLSNEAARSGVNISEKIINRAIDTVGRSPLALRLAVSLMEKDLDAFNPRDWANSLRDDPERIQANLYDRILKRIRNPDLVKIARPGLLVRRLSQDVIERVLADPCGLSLSSNSALDLLYEGRTEGQLFTTDRNDPDPTALWHRLDVRALMLPDLDLTVNDQIAHEINMRAIHYYSDRKDNISRIEELYHRLRLGQSQAELDNRWTDAAGPSLRNALAELPPQSQAYVRRRLGTASLTALAPANFDLSNADRELRDIVSRELQNVADGADPMSTLMRYGVDKMSGPLADLYAEALLATGQIDKLLHDVEELNRAPNAPLSVVAAVANIAAGVLEGLGRLAEAFDRWRTAVETAPIDDEDSIHIAIAARVGAIRTARKLDETRHFSGYERSRANEIKDAIDLIEPVLDQLSRRAVESREVVAELSDTKGLNPVPRPLFRTLARLIEAGEAFPSLIENPQNAASIARRFGLRASSPHELANYLAKAVYEADAGRVVELMREEVDWTLERAVRHAK